MKKIIALSLITLILLVPFTGCAHSNYKEDDAKLVNKVYLFSGEDDFIKISNGIIVISPEWDEFVGGSLSFKSEMPTGLKNYTAKYYFYWNGDMTSLNSTTVIIDGSEEGIDIALDMGTQSSENMFVSMDVWASLVESLHFSLSGTLIDGEKFEYDIPIIVNEVF